MVEIYNEQVRDLLSNDIAQRRYPFWTIAITFILHYNYHRHVYSFDEIFAPEQYFSWHKKTLGIWNTSQPNGLVVPDASLHLVKSTSDVLDLMEIGQANRAVGSTALNERSSRSHRLVEPRSFSTCT
jgi:kinesin family protein C2/C3